MISIITINYNNKDGLKKTIHSVLSQKSIDFEYIIVDGDSNDGSKELLELKKSSISKIVSEPDSGIYNAMNKGIVLASGEYILFLNSGDTLYNENVLNKVSKSFESNKDMYYGNLILCYNSVEIKDVYPETISIPFLYEKSLPHPATFIKKSLFEKYHYYNENLNIVADWEFFMLAIIKYNASTEHLKFFISKFDTSGISNQLQFKNSIKKERNAVMLNHFPLLSEFLNDNNLLKTNRFKLLQALEESKLAQKLNSLWLRMLLFIVKGKSLKDLK